MTRKKVYALVLCLALLIAAVLPGTLAVSNDTADSSGSFTLDDQQPVEETPTEAPPSEEDPTADADNAGETPADADNTDETPADAPARPEGCTCDYTNGQHSETCALYTAPAAADFTDLYNQLMSAQTADEFYALLGALTEEETENFRAWLTENNCLEALEAHLQAIKPEEELPETFVFTDAGPFLPAVRVISDTPLDAQTIRRAARAATNADEGDTDGLKLKKTAVDNKDGTYTITLESYTTGSVTTTTTTKPVDIVLVLDQSTSMSYSFSDDELDDWDGSNYRSRQYAMKQAVYSFIENVKQQYSADSDHRIAIVKFGSDATDVSGWTFVNDTGAASLKNGVERMQIVTNTGTQTQTGMRRANELINTQYSYSGTNTDRQKVVILFTDGIPGNYDFDPTVANSAVSYAKQIKDAGATVYAIGIFNGANVNEMYGKSGSFHDSSDGTVGSHWCASRARNGDLFVRSKAVSAVAGNRFLNLLSSNFKDATSAGLVGNEHIGGLTDWRTYYGWQISRNFTRSASNYYLTANNASSLDNIFQTISSNINTPTIDLGSETVVRDIVADCFEIPDNATEINVYTAAATADALNYPDAEASWLTRTPDPAISATVSQDGKTVSVSGFNYTDNFVAATGRGENSDFFGKKLILEFKVQPKAGFLGGNNVETNAGAGVYENDSAETPIKSFEKPTVNVPIQPVSVTAGDKNIYLLGSVTAEEIKAGAEISVGTGVRKVTLDLGMANDEEYPYGLDPWQMEYVTITVEIKDKDDKDVSVDGLDSLTDDNSYTVTVTVKPEAASAESKGTPATEQTNNATGKINVFKPELTFKDSTAYYGDTAPNFDENPPKTEWKHDGTKSTDLGVTMIGDEPQLDLTYTLEDGKIVDGKINTKQDIPVKADVAIVREGSNVNVNDHTTFVHDTCTVAGCGWNEPETKRDPAFLIHIQTCTLTIIKEGGETGESYVFTIYKDDQPYSQVTVEGNTSQTICELPVGKYTIAEDTGWSWRYTADNGGSAVLSAQNSDGSIICKNTKTIDKWLNGFSSVVRNIFGKH